MADAALGRSRPCGAGCDERACPLSGSPAAVAPPLWPCRRCLSPFPVVVMVRVVVVMALPAAVVTGADLSELCCRLRQYEFLADGIANQLGCRRQSQLSHGRSAMRFHSLYAQV